MPHQNSSNLTLFHYFRSSCSWRVRWALKLKGVFYKDHIINLLNGEQDEPSFRLANPNGSLPALAIDGRLFGESMAILEWLEETHPTPPLLPQHPVERLHVRQLSQMIVAGTHPLQNLKVLKYVSSDQGEREKWAAHWIRDGLERFERALYNSNPGTYCCGGEITFADLCLVPQAYNAKRFGLNLEDFPLINGIVLRCLTTKACDEAAPHNQPGATLLA